MHIVAGGPDIVNILNAFLTFVSKTFDSDISFVQANVMAPIKVSLFSHTPNTSYERKRCRGEL